MINDKHHITTIILAGGKSSRMGQDKALIPIQGIPLLQRTYQIAQTCTNQVYIVTPWPEKYQHILPIDCQIIPEIISPSSPKPHGPLIGFAQGLTYVKTEWVLLLACDLPCLKTETIQTWIQQLYQIPETAMAFLPHQEKGWEPLCGFYRSSCLSSLQKFINKGGKSFQKWLNLSHVQELKIKDTQVLFNCNTPEDLTQLRN